MLDLSVVIIACNEERIIGQTLEAIASFAGEIIFVDSGSTDRTLEIARQYKAQCHHQQWPGYAAQKNYALSLATKKWILSLDADEVVTEDLKKEITALLGSHENSDNKTYEPKKTTEYSGYRIPRLLYIGKKPFKYGGFYPDAQLRLFLNGKGQFIERKVHESARVEGKIGQLNSPILHYAYTDFDDYANTLDGYAKLSAQEFKESNAKNDLVGVWRTSKLNETIHPLWTFFYRFVFRVGFLDGIAGLKANWIYKDYVRKKITYLRRSQNCQPQ
jgi:glycosyltransferase involved in cell wall biosynthesis